MSSLQPVRINRLPAPEAMAPALQPIQKLERLLDTTRSSDVMDAGSLRAYADFHRSVSNAPGVKALVQSQLDALSGDDWVEPFAPGLVPGSNAADRLTAAFSGSILAMAGKMDDELAALQSQVRNAADDLELTAQECRVIQQIGDAYKTGVDIITGMLVALNELDQSAFSAVDVFQELLQQADRAGDNYRNGGFLNRVIDGAQARSFLSALALTGLSRDEQIEVIEVLFEDAKNRWGEVFLTRDAVRALSEHPLAGSLGISWGIAESVEKGMPMVAMYGIAINDAIRTESNLTALETMHATANHALVAGAGDFVLNGAADASDTVTARAADVAALAAANERLGARIAELRANA